MITHDIRDGITIVVEDKDISYHSYRDWNLYVANNDPIGEPKQYTNYVEVPGRNGKIDLSEVLAGRPVFCMISLLVSPPFFLLNASTILIWLPLFENRVAYK